MTGTGESYECAVCHGRFVKAVSDEEAEAERQATWADPSDGDDALEDVCDDCYQRLIRRVEAEAPELLRAQARHNG